MIFYDFEVFKYDWMVHFIDVINGKRKTITNNREELVEYYEQHKNDIFIGYNNIHYDQFIFKGIILGLNPYKINNHIIVDKESGWSFTNEFRKVPIIQYDTTVGFNSLKQLEAFMGHNIKETTVDFTIDRKLTDSELKEVEEYCKYDVEQTIEVFMRTQDQFNTKMDLIKEFNLPLWYISKTNAQLSATVLESVRQLRNDEFKLDIPSELKLTKYNHIKRWYQNPVNHDYKKKLEVDIAGVPHIFAWGGIHGARDNYIEDGKFVLVDVSSYYPSMMIEYDYMSRNISDKNRFINMYKERFRLKKEGNPKQAVFKLVLNTTYGCMGYKFNDLYDQRMRNNVCVTGQLLLLDLIEKLENIQGIELIQSNTDGILFRYYTNAQLDKIKEVADEWSSRTRMGLDYDYFNKIIQKDVNNYIAVGDDETVYVGAYVKQLNELDNDLPVVNKALKAYFIDGITPEKYIGNEDRLIEYQKIVKVSSKYEYAYHNNTKLPEKTLRVFASRSINDSEVLKFRVRNGKEEWAKFANTSTKSFIDNGDVNGKLAPRKLDKQWYIDLTWKRINQYKGLTK